MWYLLIGSALIAIIVTYSMVAKPSLPSEETMDFVRTTRPRVVLIVETVMSIVETASITTHQEAIAAVVDAHVIFNTAMGLTKAESTSKLISFYDLFYAAALQQSKETGEPISDREFACSYKDVPQASATTLPVSVRLVHEVDGFVCHKSVKMMGMAEVTALTLMCAGIMPKDVKKLLKSRKMKVNLVKVDSESTN